MKHSMDGKKCKWVKDDFIKDYLSKTLEYKKRQENKFKKFQEIVQREIIDCNITEVDIDQELNANIGKYQRWIDRLRDAKNSLTNLELKLKRMECELFHYYKFNCDFSDRLKYGSDVKKYIDCEECYQALYEVVQNQKALIEFITETIKNLHARGFAIKNYIDCKRIDLGIIQ